MDVPKCSFCKSESMIRIPYSGHSFCRKHFLSMYRKRVRKYVARNRMAASGDVVGLALSGGKDSLAMTAMMHEIFGKRPNVKLVAITIDEGIRGYRRHTIRRAAAACKRLGIKHHVFSFREEFGITLDEIARDKKALGELTPCAFCGVLRRALINRAAIRLGFTKLASGHNLDDEAQSIIMSLMRGNDERLRRLGAKSGVASFPESFVQRIKPLRTTPERENMLFILLEGFEKDHHECPYAGLAFRNDVRKLINHIEERHAGVKYNLLNSFDRMILPVLKREWSGKAPKKCTKCGDPASGEICQACVMLDAIKKSKNERPSVKGK